MLKATPISKEFALDYLNDGWFVMPIQKESKEPLFKFAPRGFYSASNNPAEVMGWFNECPEMNLGIACEKSGLIVLDFDYRNMTRDSWELGKELSCIETMQVETGDGIHLYFTTSVLSGVKGKLDAGIDIKYKGYVVAAPSVHPNGKRYEANGLKPVALPDNIKKWVSR